MGTRRLIGVAAALLVLLGTACGGGGPHAGAAPAIRSTTELTAKLEAVGLTCSAPHDTGFFGDEPLPQERSGCFTGKDAIGITRYRDFHEVSIALRIPQMNGACEVAKVRHIPTVPYLYGDNWIVTPDPEFPEITEKITKALDAGTWTLFCPGVESVDDTKPLAADEDPCRIVEQGDVSTLFGTRATRDDDAEGVLVSGMNHCHWKAHSEHGHVRGSIDYALVVGVMEYSRIGEYVFEAYFEGRRALSGIGDQAVYARINESGTTVQFVKNGRLVVLSYGLGPYTIENLDKGLEQAILDQASRLIATARAAAARM